MIYGEHPRDWVRWKNEEPLEATAASVAWRGRVPFLAPDLAEARLFKATWTNPQPDLEITRLEFRIGQTGVKPLVVAITLE